MKNLVIMLVMFLSLDLYGGADGSGCSRSKIDYKMDIICSSPSLIEDFKKDFETAFACYRPVFELSMSVAGLPFGELPIDEGCAYKEYKRFACFLISQFLKLGYDVKEIYNVNVCDERGCLLHKWLEVNLLSKYGNNFFEQKNEHEEEAYVKALFNDMLPGFCLVLKNQELMVRNFAKGYSKYISNAQQDISSYLEFSEFILAQMEINWFLPYENGADIAVVLKSYLEFLGIPVVNSAFCDKIIPGASFVFKKPEEAKKLKTCN